MTITFSFDAYLNNSKTQTQPLTAQPPNRLAI